MDGGGPGQAGIACYGMDVIAMADKVRTTRKTGGRAAGTADGAVTAVAPPPAADSATAQRVPLPAGVPGGQAAARVWDVLLGADEQMTATAVTVAAGVSRATVSATLAALEKAAVVLRIPGERARGKADLWVLAGGVRQGQGVAQSNAATVAAAESAQSAAVPTAALCPVSGRPKRERGQLESEVLGVLVAEYPAEFGPTALSRKLDGASSGAIANALEKLSALGKVLRTCEAPKRYRALEPPAVSEVGPDAA